MSRPAYKLKFEAKQKADGYVRGPRIRSEASQRLRDLAYRHNLTPCEVVSRLLLDEPLGADTRITASNPLGLSPLEFADLHAFKEQMQ